MNDVTYLKPAPQRQRHYLEAISAGMFVGVGLVAGFAIVWMLFEQIVNQGWVREAIVGACLAGALAGVWAETYRR